ncbi:MAG TPA: hypothetical protein VIY86_11505, partial [Pirellulaceae bacterium]
RSSEDARDAPTNTSPLSPDRSTDTTPYGYGDTQDRTNSSAPLDPFTNAVSPPDTSNSVSEDLVRPPSNLPDFSNDPTSPVSGSDPTRTAPAYASPSPGADLNGTDSLRGSNAFSMLLLFASIGLNIYLGWIAWDTYNRYQDLVSDMRSNRARRERTELDSQVEV